MATKALYRAFMHTARELERRKQPLLVQVPVLSSRVQWYKPGAPQSQYVPAAPTLSETLRERFPWLPADVDGTSRDLPSEELRRLIRQAFREVATPSAELDDTASQQLDVAFSALRELHAQAGLLRCITTLTLPLPLPLPLPLSLTSAGGAAALHFGDHVRGGGRRARACRGDELLPGQAGAGGALGLPVQGAIINPSPSPSPSPIPNPYPTPTPTPKPLTLTLIRCASSTRAMRWCGCSVASGASTTPTDRCTLRCRGAAR